MRNTRIVILPLVATGMLVALNWRVPGRLAAQQPPSRGEESKAGDSSGQPGDARTGRWQQELGAAAISEDENPLLEVARQMRVAEELIAGNDSGPRAQELQERIVADLDRLLEQARRRAKRIKPSSAQSQQIAARPPIDGPRPQQGNGGKKPTDKPAVTSSQQSGNGKTRKPDMKQMRKLMEQLWKVELPQREREQMMPLLREEFLPKYERLIEEYFRRLSEEKRW